MERLQVDQPVTLILDEVPEAIDCRVLDVKGSVSRLAYEKALPPRAVGLLVKGSAGYAIFDEFGAAVGLRVAVRAHPPYLDVALTDGLKVQERRGNERVKLMTRAQITCSAGPDVEPEAGSTYTIDISETGALLRDHPVFSGRERFLLELMFGSDPHPVAAQAEIVRRTDDAVGVRFESISADDSARLGDYLMGIRQQRRLASSS